MNTDAIGNNYQQQNPQNSVQSDFKTFRNNLQSLQTALNSGDEDQVTLSEQALAASANQLLNDMSNSAQGQTTNNSNMQNFQSNLKSLVSALTSATSGASGASTGTTPQNAVGNALNQVESDMAAMKAHGHHHHHGGENSSSTTTGTTADSSASGESSTTANNVSTELLNALSGSSMDNSILTEMFGNGTASNDTTSLTELLQAASGNSAQASQLANVLEELSGQTGQTSTTTNTNNINTVA